MRFQTWNVRSLYNSDSNTTLTREVAKCKLNSGVLQVRQENVGTETAENYTFSTKIETELSVRKSILCLYKRESC